MLKKITVFAVLFTLIIGLNIKKSFASHIPGANITYTCNPSNPLTYTFTFTMFRKCPGTHPATTAASYFTLTNTCGLVNPIIPVFNQVGVAVDVNQLCSTVTSNCSGGTEPGVWKYTYEATITFPADCDTWTLAFDLCCRDASSNLTGTSSNNMACSTTMYTATAPCNNSPVVTAAPIPYACTNTNFNYCLTIADPEGDSAYFVMVAPAGAGQTPIAHLAGYSPTAPLNNFALDPLTGCISFNHPTIGNYVVAIQINSYDANGDLIASIIHDFQIMVISCTNTPPQNPSGGIANFSGTGTMVNSNTIAACYGDVVCFDVVFSDPVDLGNNLTIIQDGTTLLPGATFTQTGTNPVTGTFCWTSQPGFTGNVVTFIAQDDGCPVMGTTGFAVNFNITTGVYAGPNQTICGAQSAQLQGYGAGSYTWTPSTGLSCTNCASPTATPGSTTTYTVTGNLVGACSNSSQVTVSVVPDFPITLNPASATICANGAVQLGATGPGSSGPYTYLWTPNSTLSNDTIFNPIANPLFTTNYTVTMTAANGCTKQAIVPVTVSGVGPTVIASPQDTTICPGESAPLSTNSYILPLTCGISSGCSGTNSIATIGNTTTATTSYTPFYGSTVNTTNYTNKCQYIYTAAELNALGYVGGTIRSLALYFSSTYAYSYDNFEIWIGCTTLDQFPSTSFEPTTSMSLVYTANNFNPIDVSWNTFNITDFDWDGTSNIIIQMCAEEDSPLLTAGSESVWYHTTSPAYRCMYYHTTLTTGCSSLTGSRVTNRPSMRFDICTQTASSPTFSWTPSATLNNSTISNPVSTPVVNTSYLLNVTSNGCTGSTIVNVNIDASSSVSASNDTTICLGDSGPLNSIFSGTQANITLPCGTPSAGCTLPASPIDVGVSASATSSYTPFYGSTVNTTNYTNKTQYIYTAAELNALGYFGGTIQSIALNFTGTYAYSYDNFEIKMGCTNLDEYTTTTFIASGSLTQVYGPINNFNPIDASWNTFNITDFDWDGTSNIVIEMCAEEDAPLLTAGSELVAYSTTTPAYRCMYYHTTLTTGCSSLTGSRVTNRPNMRFVACDAPLVPISYSWTPSTGLNNPNIANPTTTPTANTTYIVAATGGVCTQYDTVNIVMCSILPIELYSFNGRNNENVNELYWVTETEINNDYFTVERSMDGINFVSVADVAGAGNSNSLLDYHVTDYNPHTGINYYRLKQTDFNGSFSYSDLIAIEVNKKGELSIYPNPTNNFISISQIGGTLLNSAIKVFDARGKVVIEEAISSDKINYILDISKLNDGIYFVRINSDQHLFKGSFIKK